MDEGLYSKAKHALMSPLIIIILSIVAIMVIYFMYSKQISHFMPTATMRMQMMDNQLVSSKDHMCGGMDQCCKCAGNEPLSTHREVSANDLSRTAMGL